MVDDQQLQADYHDDRSPRIPEVEISDVDVLEVFRHEFRTF
jgi:hypothetical protein